MKELKIIKGETMIVYVYENGKQIDKFEIKINVNEKKIKQNEQTRTTSKELH